jgi:hypothetical protein
LLGAEEPNDEDTELVCGLFALVCVLDQIEHLGFCLLLNVLLELEEVIELAVLNSL